MQPFISCLSILLVLLEIICASQSNYRKIIRSNFQRRTSWQRHHRHFLTRPLTERLLPLQRRPLAQPFRTRPHAMTLSGEIPFWVNRRYNHVRPKAYGMCNTDSTLEKVLPEIKRMFPGQFMSQTEVTQRDQIKRENHKRRPKQKENDWVFHPSLTIQDLSEMMDDGNVTLEPMAFSRSQETRTQRLPQTEQTFETNAVRCEPVCCSTRYFHSVYENVTIDTVFYPVVNLAKEKQFIRVGFCPERNICPSGSCHQHYNKQYIVIWNVTADHWPPVDITPYDFPSHCSWIGD